MFRSSRIISVLFVLSLALAACAPATSSPTAIQPAATNTVAAPPTSAPTNTTAPTAVPPTNTPAPTSTPAPTPMPTPVATIPAASLQQAGKLLICSDIPYPPQEFYDTQGNPQGLDVEIGNAIAARLGLQPQWINSVFDTIIAAVQGGKCDIIISAMNITTDRNKSVSMIPYFQAGQGILVQKGNPQNINTQDDLCGQSVAAESGTTEAFYLSGTSDYAGKGLPAECAKIGKSAPKLVTTQKDTDALLQLQTGKVVAYMADSPVAAYYVVQHPDQFQLVGQIVEPVVEGIAMPCSETDCTNAPLSPVGTAVKAALQSMIADGTYMNILNKWDLSSGAVTLQ
jgi:polar amino acid transport system substrate-binding protein